MSQKNGDAVRSDQARKVGDLKILLFMGSAVQVGFENWRILTQLLLELFHVYEWLQNC